MRSFFFVIVCALILFSGPIVAEDKRIHLAAPQEIVENGLLRHLLPRFSLKTGVKVTPVSPGEAADAMLTKQAPDGAAATPVFQQNDGAIFHLIAPDGSDPSVKRLLDWLVSDIGQRAVVKFTVDGVSLYGPVAAAQVVEAEEVLEGDPALGEEIALRRCGRCHVVNKKNRFAGIGSTPSFGAMKTLPRWRERFETFWTLNPHPSFTQITDVTEPFDPARPSPIAPLVLTIEELDAVLAFVVLLATKDLGAPLQEQ